MQVKYKLLILAICISLSSIISAQDVCNPTIAVDTGAYEGVAIFNYGSKSKIKNQKYQSALAVGQVFIGYMDNSSFNSNVGFYGRYLLPPFALQVKATQGDLLDRIQLSWEIDALGPSPNEGFNIYRDGIFLATVGPNIRNYNDFNVIAGIAYTYSVRGLNAYGEGAESYALGFQVPNGVVTGWIRTQSGSPVPDAIVTLMPMQGFSAKFGGQDKATAAVEGDSTFIPTNHDWSMSFWIKTDSATANAGVISVGEILLYVRAKNRASGNEGIEVANLPSGSAFLSAEFEDTIQNAWNHVTLTFEDATGLMKLYINGMLINQAPFNDNPTLGEGITTETFFKVGNNGNSGEWAGKLDELRIYNILLGELDLPEIIHGTASSQTKGLTYYWKMDEELGDKSYDLKNRIKLFFCGATFDADRPPVRTAGKTNEEGYYRIESASYGTGTTFLAEPSKNFYLHKSVKFNRSQSSHISIPDFPIPQKSTIELWVNNAGSTGIQTIVSKKSASNDFKVFLEPAGVNQTLKVTLNGTTHAFGLLGNGFQHLAITIDSTTNGVQVFKNGISVGSQTFSGNLGNLSNEDNPWLLGAYDNGLGLVDYYNGLIDEFAIYDTILSPTLINDHYLNTRDMQEAALFIYFPMDEGAGDVISNVGSYLISNGTLINNEWTSFAANQVEEPHIFSPKTRQVTLNPSVTSVDQVDFTDRSTIAVSGFVRYTDTDCFAPNVEILVNGTSYNPPIFTDSLGRFLVDFDPGFTGVLKPKFEDHIFSPSTWKVTNVNSPIAGILFNDQTKRTISGQIAGGLCKKATIESDEFAYIKVRSVDGCYERLITILNQEGFFMIENLPPLEQMTVAVLHDNPLIDKFFNDKGNPTVDLSKQNDTLEFIYFAQPQIEIVSGLEQFSPTCEQIVLDQHEKKEVVIKLKEQYTPTEFDNGVCYIDSANIRIINGFADTTEERTISDSILIYEFKVGKPNPSPPYLKTFQLISTTLEGNRGELTIQGVVTGVFNKLPTFTTQLPQTPSMVLHDPPGDGSYAFIEKGQKICEKLTLNSEFVDGGGIQQIFDFGPDTELPVFFGVPDVEFESEIGPNVTAINTISKISNNSMEVCKTFNSRLSTSDDDLIVGTHGGDVFVGEGLNINFGFADVILFDPSLCEPYDSLSAVISPGRGTTFMYSEWHILNSVIPHLLTLKNLPSSTTEDTTRYQASINRWNQIITDNNRKKQNAQAIKNISFDAGTSYEYSETIDSIGSSSSTNGSNFSGSFDNSIIIKGAGIGGGVVIKAQIERISSSSKDSTNEKGVTTGYVLKDNDVLDAFSVDICIDSVYKTPLFKINAGQSSCPWEPGTAKREGVNLVCTNGPVRTDVPADGAATFTFIMGNTSSTLETWTYAFTAGPESNPHGAKIFCNGAPMNQIQWYAIPYGTSIPVTVTVERGSEQYDYDSLEIVLYSACEDQRANDLGILPDTAEFLYSAVYVSAFFIRPCSEVVINEPEQNFVIFPDTTTAGDDVVKKVSVSGYNDDPKFKSMSLQYRRSNGDGTWIAFPGVSEKYNPKWELRDSIVGPYDTLSARRYDFFEWNTLNFNDGEYEIRAVTNCSGDASDKPGYSEIIKGKIDRTPPSLVGVPQPSDGVYHVGDEISFTFNKDINCKRLIPGDMTNPNNVALYNSETGGFINAAVTCVDNKIVIDPIFENKIYENKIMRAELHNIQDLTGNILVGEQWEFYVDRNELAWLTDSIEVVKFVDETKTISAKIHNRGGYPVPFSIINVPVWLHVFPNKGTLVANEIEEIQFTVKNDLDLGEIANNIILRTETGVNPFFMGGDEPLNVKARNLCRPETWVLNHDGFNTADYSFSMNFVVQLDIEGVMSVDENDIVGAYVDGQLRGIAKIEYQPTLNKYLAFLTVYSDSLANEQIKFQIWDASDCKLYAYAMETFPFLPDDIKGTVSNCIVLHTNTTLLRKIFIHEGWNWISMNLNLQPNNINSGLASLSSPTGALIKNQTVFSGYSDTTSSWLGTLTALVPTSLYQYHSLSKDSISVVGLYVDPTATHMPVDTGWNWIGYLPTQALSVDDALTTIPATTGDIIKSQLQFAQFLSGVGWIGNLKSLNAPNGYLLKLQNAATLTYPDPLDFRGRNETSKRNLIETNLTGLTDVVSTSPENMPFAKWEVDPKKFEHNMNVIAVVVENNGTKNRLQDGDEVAAFVNGEVRGSGKALHIPALNAYMIFMTVYSNVDGEKLSFKYFDASLNMEMDVVEQMDFKINSIVGKVDRPQELHLSETTSSKDFDADRNIELYPNPFTNQLQIHYTAAKSEDILLSIKDVHGKTVDNRYLKAKSGLNNYDWQPVRTLTGGVYFISIASKDGTYSQKVLYLK